MIDYIVRFVLFVSIALCPTLGIADDLEERVASFLEEVGDLGEIAESAEPSIGCLLSEVTKGRPAWKLGLRVGDIVTEVDGMAFTQHFLPFGNLRKEREVAVWRDDDGFPKMFTIPKGLIGVVFSNHRLPFAGYLRSEAAGEAWNRYVVAAMGLCEEEPGVAEQALDLALERGFKDGALASAIRAQIAQIMGRDDEALAHLERVRPALADLPVVMVSTLYRTALGLGDVSLMAALLQIDHSLHWKGKARYGQVDRSKVPPESLAAMDRYVADTKAQFPEPALLPAIPLESLRRTPSFTRGEASKLFGKSRGDVLRSVPPGRYHHQIMDLESDLRDFEMRCKFRFQTTGVDAGWANAMHLSVREQGSDKTLLGIDVTYSESKGKTVLNLIYDDDGWAHRFDAPFEITTKNFSDPLDFVFRSHEGIGEIVVNGRRVARVLVPEGKPLKLETHIVGLAIMGDEFQVDALSAE